jgi:hypothetical protein
MNSSSSVDCLQSLIEERTRSLNEAADLLSALSLGAGSKPAGGKIDCDEMEWKFGGGNLFRKLAPATDQVSVSVSCCNRMQGDQGSML